MVESRKHDEKQVLNMLIGVGALFVAVTLLFVAPAIFSAEFSTYILILSIGIATYGLVTFCCALYDLNLNIFRKIRKLGNDKKGVAWIWVVAGLTICFLPFIYWAVGSVLDQILVFVDANYAFTGAMGSAYTLGKTIIQLLSVFALIGVLLWSVVNAKTSAYGG